MPWAVYADRLRWCPTPGRPDGAWALSAIGGMADHRRAARLDWSGQRPAV